MEREVGIAFKKQKYSELALARYSQVYLHYEARFNVDLDDFMVVLPYKPKTTDYAWITGSISHEYLHLIVAELESDNTSCLLDNLGYNLTTGYNDEEI